MLYPLSYGRPFQGNRLDGVMHRLIRFKISPATGGGSIYESAQIEPQSFQYADRSLPPVQRARSQHPFDRVLAPFGLGHSLEAVEIGHDRGRIAGTDSILGMPASYCSRCSTADCGSLRLHGGRALSGSG